jgi:hypothetical protein
MGAGIVVVRNNIKSFVTVGLLAKVVKNYA